jgi:hypothetical protein
MIIAENQLLQVNNSKKFINQYIKEYIYIYY